MFELDMEEFSDIFDEIVWDCAQRGVISETACFKANQIITQSSLTRYVEQVEHMISMLSDDINRTAEANNVELEDGDSHMLAAIVIGAIAATLFSKEV